VEEQEEGLDGSDRIRGVGKNMKAERRRRLQK
jgi:hypothetical protein